MWSHLAALAVFDLRIVVYLGGIVSVRHLVAEMMYSLNSGRFPLTQLMPPRLLARGSGTGCLSSGKTIETLLL